MIPHHFNCLLCEYLKVSNVWCKLFFTDPKIRKCQANQGMAPTSVIHTTFNGRLWISFDYSENKKNRIKLNIIINRISIYKAINRFLLVFHLLYFLSYSPVSIFWMIWFQILSNMLCLLLYKCHQKGMYPFLSFTSAIVEVEE